MIVGIDDGLNERWVLILFDVLSMRYIVPRNGLKTACVSRFLLSSKH